MELTVVHRPARKSLLAATFRRHWPEYLIEAAGLGLFMVSACAFTTLLEHPASPVRALVPDAGLRRLLMGLAMGWTAIALVYSPWGQRSGAHINPSVTLAFFRLGRVPGADALFYVLAQFAGGLLGTALARLLLGALVADPAVAFAATVPGPHGPYVAFGAEAAISFVLMLAVLTVSSRPRLASRTGLVAGALVALYITFEAPVSGMSMNPARTFASAVPSGTWTSAWIYFTAPLAGMTLAAEAFRALGGARRRACAKLHHGARVRCIFCGEAASLETNR
jgi:aquaporin Z